MDKSTITSLINALANQTAANSITPQSLANILHAINENTGNGGGGSSGGGSSLPLGLNWFFGHVCQLTTTAAVECPIVTDDTDCSSICGSVIDITTNDSDEPLLRCVSRCLVEITGFVTLKVNDSYTADRIIQIYKYDTEGGAYTNRHECSSLYRHYADLLRAYQLHVLSRPRRNCPPHAFLLERHIQHLRKLNPLHQGNPNLINL